MILGIESLQEALKRSHSAHESQRESSQNHEEKVFFKMIKIRYTILKSFFYC